MLQAIGGFNEPPHPSWEKILKSSLDFFPVIYGSVLGVIQNVDIHELDENQDFELNIEIIGLTIRLVEQISFERGGQKFRNSVVEYIQEPFAAAIVDAYFFEKTASSEKQARERLSEYWTNGVNRLPTIYSDYAAKSKLVAQNLPNGREKTVVGVFEDRVINLLHDPPKDIKNHLAWITGFSGLLGVAEVESDINASINDAKILDNPQKERQATQPRPATDSQQENRQSSAPKTTNTTNPAPRRDLTPAEKKWAKVVWAMRRTKNRKFVVGSILRHVETPKPNDGKITFRFTSNALKNNFMEEMQDQRSRDALKAAITDTYGSELELQVISPHEAIEKKYPSVMDIWHFEHEPSNSLAVLAASTAKYAHQVLDGTYEIVGGVMDLESLPPDQEWYLMLEAIGYSMECLNLATYSVAGPDYRHYAMNNIEMFVSAQLTDRYFNLRSPESAEQSKSTLLSAGNDIGQRLSGIYQRYEQALSEMGTDYAESIEGALGKTYIQQVDLIIETPAGESIFRDIDAKMRFQITLTAATLECEMDKYAELGVSDFEKLESSDEKA